MTWLPSGTPSVPIGHPSGPSLAPRRAAGLAPRLAPSGIPFGPLRVKNKKIIFIFIFIFYFLFFILFISAGKEGKKYFGFWFSIPKIPEFPELHG
jgi:hypothetical protein